MNNSCVPVLLTSTIKPSASFTNLSDPVLRREQYRAAIYYWLAYTSAKSIVFCDNSNSRPFTIDEALLLEECFNKRIELLTFEGNSDKSSLLGKGYGEGEIINFALQNSVILNQSDFFYKCTGRIIVSNFDEISQRYCNTPIFYHMSTLSRGQIDTRFFLANKSDYIRILSTVHQSVNDGNGYYFEHAVYEGMYGAAKMKGLRIPYPRYLGLSGSTGLSYNLSSRKYLRNNLISLSGFWGLTYKE